MGFPLWVVGVLMSILASFCNTTGLLLQKFAHQRLAEAAKDKAKAAAAADEAAAKRAARVSIGDIREEDEEDPDDAAAKTSSSSSRTSVTEVAMQVLPPEKRKAGVSMLEDTDDGAGTGGGDDAARKGNGNKEDEEEEEEEVAGFWRHPVWVMGFGMVVIGALLDVATFGFAPQSLLAPIASLSLVFNTLLAPRFLGETLSLRDIMATGVIVVGTIVVVIFAPHDTPEYTVQDMRDLYTRPITIVFFIVNGGVMVLLFMVTGKFSVDAQPTTGVWKSIYPFSFPTLAGIFGGMSVLFSKCGIEMVKTSVATDNQFVYPEPYVFIVLIAVFLFLQVKFLNAGLALFDALYVIPVYQVWWMISGILGGSFYFDEFRNFGTTQWIMFPLGTFINIVGIYILTQRGGYDESDEEEEAAAAAAAAAESPGGMSPSARSASSSSRSPLKSPGLSRKGRMQVVALDAQRRASMLFFGVDNSAVAAMGQHERVDNLSFVVPSPIKPAIRRVSQMMTRHFVSLAPVAAPERREGRRSSAMAGPAVMRLQSAERREMAKQRRHSEMPSLSRPGSTESAGDDHTPMSRGSFSTGRSARASIDLRDDIVEEQRRQLEEREEREQREQDEQQDE